MYKNGNQKIANLLGDADNESPNLQQQNDMLSMIKTTLVVQMLNLKLRSLNQIFVIFQGHIFLEQGI